MKSNGSMNRAYRVVWNAAKSVWQAVCETGKSHGKQKSVRSLRRTAALAGIVCTSSAFAAPLPNELPTGGNVVAGAASISTSGSRMDVLQTTQRTAIDWNTFNIGSAAHVHFAQPSGGVALNRVLDTNASQIYGKLTSTGQVFLVNPNGVFFAPGAQVDVGGIVASTLNLSNADFMAGNYKFEGNSSNAIINQGNITARGDGNGGTIALIAAKIANNGTLTANGGNVLLGAGSKVTLDMGGPVKLQIENDALETLIQNGGAIKADGGTVWLTSQAATTLASSVINNTGVIEAQTLATGEKGEIILFAHGGEGYFAGTLDASAPNGGDGGFIETSAKMVSFGESLKVSAAATNGKAGEWLIDPTDITIGASSCTGTNCIDANTIANTLNGGTDVTVATSVTNTASERGDINVNANISWNQKTLILSAHNDIWIRGALTGTGTAKLGLEYGQSNSGSTSNTTSYTVLGSVSLPNNSFYAKFGTNGATTFTDMPVFLNNGYMRFGNGTSNSVDQFGSLLQPFYYNATDNRWYKLTYSNSPMYLNIGFGGTGFADGTIISNQNGKDINGLGDFDNLAANYIGVTTFDLSGYANGRGTIIASNTINDGGVSLVMRNTYTLGAGNSYLEATTKVTNAGATSVDNVRLWTGTRDDWIGLTDGPRKEKGNFVNGVFVPNTAIGQAASVIRVTSDTEGILFYSTSTGAETTIGECCSPDFHLNTAVDNQPLLDPRDTPFESQPLVENYSTDGNYSVFSSFGSMAANANKSIIWYYAGGEIADLVNIVTEVTQAAEVATGGSPPPTPTPNVPLNTSVSLAQNTPVGQGTSPVFDVSGGLTFVQVSAPQGQDGGDATTTNIGSAADLPQDVAGRDPLGFIHVFVVNGGIKLPDVALGETGQTNQDERNQ